MADAGSVRSDCRSDPGQIDASARDINRFVRKHILDDAFAPLKLRELETKTSLAPAYQIKAVMSGKRESRLLDHFELIAADPPLDVQDKKKGK